MAASPWERQSPSPSLSEVEAGKPQDLEPRDLSALYVHSCKPGCPQSGCPEGAVLGALPLEPPYSPVCLWGRGGLLPTTQGLSAVRGDGLAPSTPNVQGRWGPAEGSQLRRPGWIPPVDPLTWDSPSPSPLLGWGLAGSTNPIACPHPLHGQKNLISEFSLVFPETIFTLFSLQIAACGPQFEDKFLGGNSYVHVTFLSVTTGRPGPSTTFLVVGALAGAGRLPGGHTDGKWEHTCFSRPPQRPHLQAGLGSAHQPPLPRLQVAPLGLGGSCASIMDRPPPGGVQGCGRCGEGGLPAITQPGLVQISPVSLGC